jgi:hypothetical protein
VGFCELLVLVQEAVRVIRKINILVNLAIHMAIVVKGYERERERKAEAETHERENHDERRR